MDRTELVQLHAALEAVISWPDSVRAEVARWLSHDGAPNGAPGEKKARKATALKTAPPQMRRRSRNGRDPHPPRTAPSTGRGRPHQFPGQGASEYAVQRENGSSYKAVAGATRQPDRR